MADSTIRTPLNMTGNVVYGAADPTDPQDLATKAYVDSLGSASNDTIALAINEAEPYSTYRVVGQRTFSENWVADYSSFIFRATGYVTDASLTGSVQLYDLTAASSITVVTFNSVTPSGQGAPLEAALINDHIYEIRIKTNAFIGPDKVFVLMSADIQGVT